MPRLLFLIVGAVGCLMLFLSAVLPYDDLVQQECTPKTWCDGLSTSQMEKLHVTAYHPIVFVLSRAYDHAPARAAGEVLSSEVFHASTVVIGPDHGRGPPFPLISHDPGDISPTHS